jgi:hypothetical protein
MAAIPALGWHNLKQRGLRLPGLDSQPKGLDFRKTHEGLHKMSLHSKNSCKNVVILGRKIVAVLFVFIHIVASFVVFNILLFSTRTPRDLLSKI